MQLYVMRHAHQVISIGTYDKFRKEFVRQTVEIAAVKFRILPAAKILFYMNLVRNQINKQNKTYHSD